MLPPMRTLLIDIGNTSVKFGLAENGSPVIVTSLPTDPSMPPARLVAALLDLSPAGVDDCVACSVVPAMDLPLSRAVASAFDVVPRFAHRDIPVPLTNRYERPAEVGADRLVAAYAARLLVPDAPALISVDYGTATTFDCVRGNDYLGGLIAPGVFSSLHALAAKTAQLPRIDLSAPDRRLAIGRNTVTSMNGGFLFGFAAMTEGIVSRLHALLPSPCPLVATGGFAKALSRVIRFDRLEPNLILDGLNALR